MKDKWNLEKIYADDAAVEAAIAHIEEQTKELVTLKENPEKNLLAIMDHIDHISMKLETLVAYAFMKRDEDSTVAKQQKLALRVEGMIGKVSAELSFLDPYLLGLSEEAWKKIRDDKAFEAYGKYMDRLARMRAHTLSEKEEYILSKTSDIRNASENAFYMLTNADMTFPVLEEHPDKVELTQSNFVPILTEGHEALRKEAFEKYYAVYAGHIQTIATTLYTNVKSMCVEAELRHHKSARDFALYANNISGEVYDALVASVREHLPALHEYYELKKEMLGMDEMHMYDVYMPALADYDRKIPYEEAKEMVLGAVKPLGEEYVSIIKRAFDEDWIDVYPQKGKKSGAYSFGSYESDPYILMNYNDNLDSVFTLAHELGHSVHSYYSRNNNPHIYSEYTLFVAEVASTFNEMLLLDYLLKRAESREEKMYLINHYLDTIKGTIYRQTQFAEFEDEVHKRVMAGEALTAEDFNALYADLNEAYYKPLVNDEEIKYEWARIPHFYSNFYVYQYATGLSAAITLSEGVLAKKEGALEAYKNFLKNGGQNFPIDQLRAAGADMENPATVGKALEKFHTLVREMRKLYEEGK